MLAQTRGNNEALGISGMLIHHRGQFLQVLEGAEVTVRRLFESISRDPRHERIDELVSLQMTQRTFGDWTMGFDNADVENLSANPAFRDFLGRSFSRPAFVADPSIAAKLLLSFRDGRLAAKVGQDPQLLA